MKEARNLRVFLAHKGYSEKELPKHIGNAGRQWFCRWRRHYDITMTMSWMKLKVPWKKIKKRIGVFLSNFMRLRQLWKLCRGDVPARFLSVDQKPSWFNNAGHTGTFAKRGARPHLRDNHQTTGRGTRF